MNPHYVKLGWSTLFIVGWVAMVHGVRMISQPAAWIVGGILLAGCAFFVGIDYSRNAHSEKEPF